MTLFLIKAGTTRIGGQECAGSAINLGGLADTPQASACCVTVSLPGRKMNESPKRACEATRRTAVGINRSNFAAKY